MLSINKQRTNVIMGEKSICIHGRDHIFETLCGLDFKISAESFLQVNSVQAEVLYNTLFKQLSLCKTDTVLDLYCGAGTISVSYTHLA